MGAKAVQSQNTKIGQRRVKTGLSVGILLKKIYIYVSKVNRVTVENQQGLKMSKLFRKGFSFT